MSDRIVGALAAAHDAAAQMSDPSVVRVHQHGAWAKASAVGMGIHTTALCFNADFAGRARG
jgi:hypothetical protein